MAAKTAATGSCRGPQTPRKALRPVAADCKQGRMCLSELSAHGHALRAAALLWDAQGATKDKGCNLGQLRRQL